MPAPNLCFCKVCKDENTAAAERGGKFRQSSRVDSLQVEIFLSSLSHAGCHLQYGTVQGAALAVDRAGAD